MRTMIEPPQGERPQRPANPKADGREAGPRVIESAELLQGESEVLIRHGDEVYRLRQTRTGKLLLYK